MQKLGASIEEHSLAKFSLPSAKVQLLIVNEINSDKIASKEYLGKLQKEQTSPIVFLSGHAQDKKGLFCITPPLRLAHIQTLPKKINEIPKVPVVDPPPKSIRLLLVDDNAMNRRVCTILLKKLGITPDIAEDGQESLELLNQKTYDLILMDCHMPRLDGFAATSEIRSNPNFNIHASTPIIAFSANTSYQDRLRCKEAKMDDFIAKPVSFPALVKMIEKWTCPIMRAKGRDDYAVTNELFAPQELLLRIEDEALCLQLQRDFIAQCKELIQNLIESSDCSQFAKKAQNLKAVCRDLSCEAMAACCEKIEKSAQRQSLSSCTEASRDLQNILEQTIHAITANLLRHS